MRRKIGTIGTAAVIFAAGFIFTAAPNEVFAQKKCGGEGQRPCRVWERIPSCDRGLSEDFRRDMCVGPRTQLDARTGRYIPRKPEARMTSVNFCNKSYRPMIDIAYAQYDGPRDGWVTTGWYSIASGKCGKVNIAEDYTGAIYTYAKAPDGSVWNNGPTRFCVKAYEAFETPNADRLQCPTRDFAVVNMVKYDLKPGLNTVTFTD